jgi:hypothetical protein
MPEWEDVVWGTMGRALSVGMGVFVLVTRDEVEDWNRSDLPATTTWMPQSHIDMT